jgi:hypothetical protein
LLPDDAFLPLAGALLVLSSHGALQEPFENCVALFALLYSLQLAHVTSSREASRAT